MTVGAPFELLPDFLAWANTRVLHSLRGPGSAPTDARRWFAHVLAAEELWLARLQGRESALAVWPELAPDELGGWIGRNAEGFRDYLDRNPAEILDTTIGYTNSQGVAHRSRVRDVLIHVIAHGTHHRGQIATSVKAAGGTPAATDYVFFARGGA